jgi:2-polyprenyl-6-hydroxyphenyl methylase/3-demethylubiquinone-9 3-methyltransferase
MSSTIDPQEVEKFSRIAEEWWDENGKFRPLHKFNPVRLSFIRRKIEEYFILNSNLRVLDIGCGGGLVSEPLARMGANVTAIDASQKNIAVAKNHAAKSQLKIDYRATVAEDLAQEVIQSNKPFDVVLALEVIEHVLDAESFMQNCCSLIKPGGLFFVATINRTVKSLILAKIAAEYILHWLAPGTHNWKKFLKPSEINFYAGNYDCELLHLQGFSYNILKNKWIETRDLNVNYMAVFRRR